MKKSPEGDLKLVENTGVEPVTSCMPCSKYLFSDVSVLLLFLMKPLTDKGFALISFLTFTDYYSICLNHV